MLKKSLLTDNFALVEEIIALKKWKQLKLKLKTKIDVSCRFQPNGSIIPSNLKENTIDAVIIGPCGNGKTCLINHICGSDLAHGSANSSLTRHVTQLPAQFLYKPQFIVYDTPGTSSIQEKMQHAVLLKEILTWKPLNCVFILVKYNNRFDQLIKTINTQVRLIKGYEQSVVFLVSHFDLEKQPKVAKEAINKMLD